MLPAEWYYDDAHYRHELECIWRRQWLDAGHVSSLAAHGSYLTVDIETQSIRRP